MRKSKKKLLNEDRTDLLENEMKHIDKPTIKCICEMIM